MFVQSPGQPLLDLLSLAPALETKRESPEIGGLRSAPSSCHCTTDNGDARKKTTKKLTGKPFQTSHSSDQGPESGGPPSKHRRSTMIATAVVTATLHIQVPDLLAIAAKRNSLTHTLSLNLFEHICLLLSQFEAGTRARDPRNSFAFSIIRNSGPETERQKRPASLDVCPGESGVPFPGEKKDEKGHVHNAKVMMVQ